MAYEKTLWTNGATALSAENMNHIENGIAALDEGKVDKENGKGLSANDFTNAAKTKLDGLPSSVQQITNKTITYTTTSTTISAGSDKTFQIPLELSSFSKFVGIRGVKAKTNSNVVASVLLGGWHSYGNDLSLDLWNVHNYDVHVSIIELDIAYLA